VDPNTPYLSFTLVSFFDNVEALQFKCNAPMLCQNLLSFFNEFYWDRTVTSMKKMFFSSIIFGYALLSAMYGIFDLTAISTAFHSLILTLAVLIVLPFIFIVISLGAVILVTAKKEHKIFFQTR
jgi:hypothetical protein